jgi:hypothetical protein
MLFFHRKTGLSFARFRHAGRILGFWFCFAAFGCDPVVAYANHRHPTWILTSGLHLLGVAPRQGISTLMQASVATPLACGHYQNNVHNFSLPHGRAISQKR